MLFLINLLQKQPLSYLKGTEWNAVDYRDEVNSASTSHLGNPAYNGLNVYGDEVGTTLNWDDLAGTPAGTLGITKSNKNRIYRQ